jgi:hypothetical protein
LFRNKFASLQNFNRACERVVTSAGLVFAFTMLAMLSGGAGGSSGSGV